MGQMLMDGIRTAARKHDSLITGLALHSQSILQPRPNYAYRHLADDRPEFAESILLQALEQSIVFQMGASTFLRFTQRRTSDKPLAVFEGIFVSYRNRDLSLSIWS
jgi:hypothetical protein